MKMLLLGVLAWLALLCFLPTQKSSPLADRPNGLPVYAIPVGEFWLAFLLLWVFPLEKRILRRCYGDSGPKNPNGTRMGR